MPKEVQLEKYRRQFIEGHAVLEEGLRTKGKSFLIISVRNLENPMPLAVLRVKDPSFPYRFKITGRHKLSHERIMEGDVIITARLSSSNTAEPQKGDLIGSINAKVGTKNIKIIINSEVE